MTRAQQLLNEAREQINEAKAKSFEEWLSTNHNYHYDETFKLTVLKPRYENNRESIVGIRTTPKTMEEIKSLANVELISQKGTYYLIKVSA